MVNVALALTRTLRLPVLYHDSMFQGCSVLLEVYQKGTIIKIDTVLAKNGVVKRLEFVPSILGQNFVAPSV